MEPQIYSQLSSLLDKGIIAGLFVICFLLFIWKGIPYFVSFIERMQREHTSQITAITKTYESTMEQITTKFIAQIERQHNESTRFHQEHFDALKEVKKGLEDVKNQSIRKK